MALRAALCFRSVVWDKAYAVHKTTLYLPKVLKEALARAAAVRGCSEAELVRQALRDSVGRHLPPEPRLPLFHSRKPGLAERIGDALAGFGER